MFLRAAGFLAVKHGKNHIDGSTQAKTIFAAKAAEWRMK